VAEVVESAMDKDHEENHPPQVDKEIEREWKRGSGEAHTTERNLTQHHSSRKLLTAPAQRMRKPNHPRKVPNSLPVLQKENDSKKNKRQPCHLLVCLQIDGANELFSAVAHSLLV